MNMHPTLHPLLIVTVLLTITHIHTYIHTCWSLRLSEVDCWFTIGLLQCTRLANRKARVDVNTRLHKIHMVSTDCRLVARGVNWGLYHNLRIIDLHIPFPHLHTGHQYASQSLDIFQNCRTITVRWFACFVARCYPSKVCVYIFPFMAIGRPMLRCRLASFSIPPMKLSLAWALQCFYVHITLRQSQHKLACRFMKFRPQVHVL